MDIYEAIVALRTAGRGGALVTLLARSGSAPMPDRAKMLVHEDGAKLGTVGGGALEARLVDEALAAIASGKASVRSFDLTAASDPELGMICGGTVEFLIEPVSSPPEVLVLGAGHVGGAVARVLAPMDFRVVVADDRGELLTPERLPGVRTIHGSLAEAFAAAPPGPRSYVVITSRSHELEVEALRRALATPAPYIGMLGSAKKAAAVRARMAAEGFDGLERLRCPVGLPIGADDPLEIAVSITAEVVAHRRGALSRTAPVEVAAAVR